MEEQKVAWEEEVDDEFPDGLWTGMIKAKNGNETITAAVYFDDESKKWCWDIGNGNFCWETFEAVACYCPDGFAHEGEAVAKSEAIAEAEQNLVVARNFVDEWLSLYGKWVPQVSPGDSRYTSYLFEVVKPALAWVKAAEEDAKSRQTKQ